MRTSTVVSAGFDSLLTANVTVGCGALVVLVVNTDDDRSMIGCEDGVSTDTEDTVLASIVAVDEASKVSAGDNDDEAADETIANVVPAATDDLTIVAVVSDELENDGLGSLPVLAGDDAE